MEKSGVSDDRVVCGVYSNAIFSRKSWNRAMHTHKFTIEALFHNMPEMLPRLAGKE